jgi:hypothetical protein
VELWRAIGDGCLFVDHDGQRLIGDINEFQCVVGRLTGLGDNERDAFPDKTNPARRHHRPIRHHGTGDDPVGFDVGDFS